ncbi:unnamed protein product [Gordionus sp. m RMFG-2023]
MIGYLCNSAGNIEANSGYNRVNKVLYKDNLYALQNIVLDFYDKLVRTFRYSVYLDDILIYGESEETIRPQIACLLTTEAATIPNLTSYSIIIRSHLHHADSPLDRVKACLLTTEDSFLTDITQYL